MLTPKNPKSTTVTITSFLANLISRIVIGVFVAPKPREAMAVANISERTIERETMGITTGMKFFTAFMGFLWPVRHPLDL